MVGKDDQKHLGFRSVRTGAFGEVLSDAWSAVAILGCALSFIAYLFQSKALTTYGEMYYAVLHKLFAVIAH